MAFSTLDAYTLFGLGVSIAVFWLFSTDLDSSRGEREVGWTERNCVSMPLQSISWLQSHSSFGAPSAQYLFAIILTLINLLNYLKISILHDLELVIYNKSLSSCSNCYGGQALFNIEIVLTLEVYEVLSLHGLPTLSFFGTIQYPGPFNKAGNFSCHLLLRKKHFMLLLITTASLLFVTVLTIALFFSAIREKQCYFIHMYTLILSYCYY